MHLLRRCRYAIESKALYCEYSDLSRLRSFLVIACGKLVFRHIPTDLGHIARNRGLFEYRVVSISETGSLATAQHLIA